MIDLHPSWREKLQPELNAPYMTKLISFLQQELKAGKTIYPNASQWFNAFDQTPLEQVKVVILGQDPYHGAGQAHGLCFSVQHGVKPPPSLMNIYKELETDLRIDAPSHGNLEAWARQGVLLLNSVLTVEAGLAASHQGKGWERFTDAVIRVVNNEPRPIVFILWGNYAQKKADFVDDTRHCIVKSAHPSPLSARNGFLGSKPFSKTNDFLRRSNQAVINWSTA